jgi:hypothetical protein
METKYQAPIDAKVLQFGQAEEIAVNKELAEFKKNPELMLDEHQRWYLNMIAYDAPTRRQRRQARKMLDETIWRFSSKCLDLPATRQGNEEFVVTISCDVDTATTVPYDRK